MVLKQKPKWKMIFLYYNCIVKYIFIVILMEWFFDLLTFYKKKYATHVLFNQRNGRNEIIIGVNKGLLGEESSMKMNLPFDHAKKIDQGHKFIIIIVLFDFF